MQMRIPPPILALELPTQKWCRELRCHGLHLSATLVTEKLKGVNDSPTKWCGNREMDSRLQVVSTLPMVITNVKWVDQAKEYRVNSGFCACFEIQGANKREREIPIRRTRHSLCITKTSPKLPIPAWFPILSSICFLGEVLALVRQDVLNRLWRHPRNWQRWERGGECTIKSALQNHTWVLYNGRSSF